MEFNFNIAEILPGNLTVVEPQNSRLKIYDLKNCEEKYWLSDAVPNMFCNSQERSKKENFETLIDNIGFASAQAQDLLSPITSFKKLLNSNDQKLYLLRNEISLIGLLKIGVKRLYMYDDSNIHHETVATCILDFYIHESKQRCGLGHKLFEVMLKNEDIFPEKLAIDRPSLKFLSFLKKHYDMKDPKPQANNFVVYSGFFKSSGTNEGFSQQSPFYENDNLSASFTSQQMHTLPTANKIEYSCDRNGGNLGICDYFKKKRLPSTTYHKNGIPSSNQKKWGVNDALHSYCENDNFSDRQRTSYSQRPNDPSLNVSACNQKKWNQLQSSWNVLGVKPLDYSNIRE